MLFQCWLCRQRSNGLHNKSLHRHLDFFMISANCYNLRCMGRRYKHFLCRITAVFKPRCRRYNLERLNANFVIVSIYLDFRRLCYKRFVCVSDNKAVHSVNDVSEPFVTQPSKIKIDPYNNKVSVKPFKVVSSTSWLQYGGYAAQKMLIPSSHAPQVITVCGNHKEIKVTM